MTDRAALSQAFVARVGWATASRRFLAGDASDRSYDRLTIGARSAVLMDAPPGKGDDPAAFLAIASHLDSLGLSAPQLLAKDLEQGFLLLEDLGDNTFARLLARVPDLEMRLYDAAMDVLLHLHRQPPPPGLPDLSASDWAQAAGFALDWYAFAITGSRSDPAPFHQILRDTLSANADGPRVLILRDYHAENLLWLPDRTGIARVGLLDFQLAQMGQPGYDLVSLCQDARRDVAPQTEAALVARFAASQTDPAAFSAAYAALGAQRALRILGVFARLCLVAGKPGYAALIPRVWGQLHRNLAHPALAKLRRICAQLLPEPSPEALSRITDQCGQHPLR